MLGQAAPRVASINQPGQVALHTTVLKQLAAALLAAAVLEVLLLRLVTRVGVHLPKEGWISSAFESASLLGSLAFNFASLLAIALVVLVLSSMVLRLGGGPAGVALAGLSLAMLWGLGMSLTSATPTADALFGLATTLLVGFIGLVLVRQREASPAVRLALALIVAAYLCYQYYTLSYLLYRLLDYSALPPLGVPVLRLGEVLAVAAGGAVFWAWGIGRWRSVGRLGVAAVVAIVLAIALAGLSPASTMSILALWTTGLTLVLPFPLYILSFALYLLTLVACWRSGGDRSWTAAGLLLVLLAGYMPEATYHHLLLLLGVALLSGALREAEPSPSTATLGERAI